MDTLNKILFRCRTCGENKPKNDFWPNGSGNPRPDCKKCFNVINLESVFRQRYGIAYSEAKLLLKSQDDKCSICKTFIQFGNVRKGEFRRSDEANVDHDHINDKVRAILCNRCNRTLGMVNDDPELLMSMVQYLLDYKDGN